MPKGSAVLLAFAAGAALAGLLMRRLTAGAVGAARPAPTWSQPVGPNHSRYPIFRPDSHRSPPGYFYAGVRWNRPVRDLASSGAMRDKRQAVVAYPDGREEIWFADPSRAAGQVQAELARHPGARLLWLLPSAASFEAHLPPEALGAP